jgi:hypothetical protein
MEYKLTPVPAHFLCFWQTLDPRLGRSGHTRCTQRMFVPLTNYRLGRCRGNRPRAVKTWRVAALPIGRRERSDMREGALEEGGGRWIRLDYVTSKKRYSGLAVDGRPIARSWWRQRIALAAFASCGEQGAVPLPRPGRARLPLPSIHDPTAETFTSTLHLRAPSLPLRAALPP